MIQNKEGSFNDSNIGMGIRNIDFINSDSFAYFKCEDETEMRWIHSATAF